MFCLCTFFFVHVHYFIVTVDNFFYSFDDFSRAITLQAIDDGKLEDAKINIKSIDCKPQSPSQKALTYFRRRLFLVTDDYRFRLRKDLSDLSLSDVEDARPLLLSLIKEGSSARAIITDKKEEEELRKKGYEIFFLPL